jgi:uncharacterized protein YodC (DUF2158 family)
MSLSRRRFNASDLALVASAEGFADTREPPLRLGNLVRLNSGGPTMVVVDIQGLAAICAWRARDGKTHEHSFPVACVHRVSIASSSI